MKNYTDEPWFIRDGDEWKLDVVTKHGELSDGSPSLWNIATINGRRENARGNLWIISKAPEMLEALESALRAIEHEFGEDHVLAIDLKEKIVKFRGES